MEGINKAEVYESDDYIETVTNYIIANHNRKTHNGTFTAMFCVSSVDMLIKYYDLLKEKKDEGKHNLNIATIFSYGANADDKTADGFIGEEDYNLAAEEGSVYKILPRRDKLDEYINDFNEIFNTRHSAKDGNAFLNYKKDISKKGKKPTN